MLSVCPSRSSPTGPLIRPIGLLCVFDILFRMFSYTREKRYPGQCVLRSPWNKENFNPWKSVLNGNRTCTVQQKGCAERIAPIGTLSQNGYGERRRLYSSAYLTTNTSAVSVTIIRTKSGSHRNATKQSMLKMRFYRGF